MEGHIAAVIPRDLVEFYVNRRRQSVSGTRDAITCYQRRASDGLEAVIERPDGTLIHVAPYPTPLLYNSGTLIGAVNMVVDSIDRIGAPTWMRSGIDCRNVGRRDYQQGARKHHHKLEPAPSGTSASRLMDLTISGWTPRGYLNGVEGFS